MVRMWHLENREHVRNRQTTPHDNCIAPILRALAPENFFLETLNDVLSTWKISKHMIKLFVLALR